jgi:hypothetical protein
MTIVLDLLGSWIIRASLITVMLTLTVSLNNALYQSNQQATAKQMIVAVDSIIYSDLNMAGYNVVPTTYPYYAFGTPGSATITDTNVTFYGDLNGGGTPETIRYWTSYDNTTGLRKLYRYVNNENGGKDLSLGNNFKSVAFKYYNMYGKVTTRADSVVAVRVQLTTQAANSVSSAYSSITGKFTVTTDFQVHPANL